ncbi:MAG: acyl carrier protein [Planctomycetota bacterium]|jgi:acyl carrier protein
MEINKVEKMEHSQIIEQLCRILEPWVSDSDLLDSINEQTNLIAELGLDSVGILEVVMDAEKEFDISIKNQELDSDTFSKLGNFVSLLQNKIYENN